MYSPQVIDHFEHPRNAGELADATVTVVQENPACGDVMQLSLRVTAGVVSGARFKTKGCATSIACSSVLCEMVEEKSVARARSITREEIVEALGGLSNETMHASYLAYDALQAALARLPR